MTKAKASAVASAVASEKAQDIQPPAHPTGQRVGYVRVSSEGQNEARQLDGVTLDRTFTDKASGKDTQRPQLQAMLDYVREGDHLYVHSMDRLARSLSDLEGIVKGLTGRRVAVTFTTQAMTFTGEDSPMNTLMLQLLGAVGQFERSLIRERQREGIAIAKTKGVYKGRKPLHTPEQRAMIAAKAMGPFVHRAAIAKEYGISRQTLYSYLTEAGQDHAGAMKGSGPWDPTKDSTAQSTDWHSSVKALGQAQAIVKEAGQAAKALGQAQQAVKAARAKR